MNINEQFLSEFMQRVDLELFTPSLYRYLTDFLEIEKIRIHDGRYVISTFIPPFPGKAFERFLTGYFGNGSRTRIQSADLAVTNACVYHCRHCYNAGRRINDLPTARLQEIVRRLQDSGAIVVNFTGGEPCLRRDLVDICSALRDDSCGILATTGYGFDDDLADALRDTRVYSISLSLDSAREKEHDRGRNAAGAYRIALRGIETAKRHGFYVYTCVVPTKQLLLPDNFDALYELNRNLGVDEMQILEPAPAGRLLGSDLDFGENEIGTIWQYMAEYNRRSDGPAVTSFAHMESPEFFGCGAGHSHIYVDGSGEVSPCNMLPISYGNAAAEELDVIIDRMQAAIRKPCRTCLAFVLRDYFREHAGGRKPISAQAAPPLPLLDEPLPRFFQIISDRGRETAGVPEIIAGYSDASVTYDDYWLTVASGPIDEMLTRLSVQPDSTGLDCGCGTGYATAKLAGAVGQQGKVISIDLTPAMVEKAKTRITKQDLVNVEFRIADVLDELTRIPPQSIDIVVSTWLIGYVGCEELFPLVKRVLKPGGIFGVVAHADRSPLIPIEVFEEISREEPECLLKAAAMKFPADGDEMKMHLTEAGFVSFAVTEGTFDFVGRHGRDVYDHVMKSGAGTTFYYSLAPECRERLAEEFIRRIDRKFAGSRAIAVKHRYIIATATA
jgi:MoaA/NifB/PqqE/SkfB family radical SAM enzyme/ubiquinone/menaquinone biosynthesis C-methylase UbiE